MNAMQHPVRGFAMTIVLLWIAACIGGLIYAQQQSIPTGIAIVVMPAILIELLFYVATGVEGIRRRFERGVSPTAQAAILTASAITPYILYTAPLGLLHTKPLGGVAALAALVSFWFVLLPRRRIVDVLLLVVMATVLVGKVMPDLYPRPMPRLRLDVLGQLMWFRLGIMAFTSIRKMEGVRLGFIPEKREWAIGIGYFLLFIPVALAANHWIGFARYTPPSLPWWQESALACATFAGFLWVVAYGEEFFFRGLLQQWLSQWLGGRAAGLITASVLFGFVHLWFRQFPNYRFAMLAALAGLFYGLSFQQGRGVRAAMVTHALVVTAWRTFYS